MAVMTPCLLWQNLFGMEQFEMEEKWASHAPTAWLPVKPTLKMVDEIALNPDDKYSWSSNSRQSCNFSKWPVVLHARVIYVHYNLNRPQGLDTLPTAITSDDRGRQAVVFAAALPAYKSFRRKRPATDRNSFRFDSMRYSVTCVIVYLCMKHNWDKLK